MNKNASKKSNTLIDQTFQTIFEQSPISTQIFSPDGTLLAVNKAFESFLGVTLGDINGYNILKDPQLITLKVMPRVRKAFKGQTVTIPPVRYVPDHSIPRMSSIEYIWTKSLIYPVKNEEGKVIRVVLQHQDITETKRHEEDAKVPLQVLESMVEGVNVSDENGVILFTNPAEDEIFGYNRGELIGQHVTILNSYPAEENQRIVAEVIKQLSKKGYWSGEWSNIKKDGTQFTTFARITAIELNGKKHWVCVQEDITEQKKDEERKKFLERVSDSLATSLEDMVTLQDIAKLAVPNLADYCRIAILSKNKDIQQLTVNHTDPEKITLAEDLYEYYKDRPEMTHGVQRILRSGKPEIIEEVDDKVLATVKNNPQLIKAIKEIGLKSYMGVPLVVRGKVIGAMTFSSVKKNRYYSNEDLRFVEDLAHRIALALDNARLFKEAQAEIQDRKQIEEDLLNSREQYRRLIDLSPMPMAIHTAGNVVYTNQAAVRLIGAKSATELVGKNIMQFIHPEYQDLVKKRVAAIYKEKKKSTDIIEERFIRLDGEIIEVEIASLFIEYEGKPAIQVIIRDITESKKAEEALRYQKSLLEAQREVAPEGVLVVTPDGRMVSYNNRFIKMWNFSEELMKQGIDEVALKEAAKQIVDPEEFLKQVKEAYSSHQAMFDTLLFKDGRVFDRYGSPVIAEDGTDYGYVWFFQDVTERVRLEQQKDEFLGIASHELKTPVTSLKAFGQVLQNRFAKTGDEKSVLLLGKMDGQINKLTYLIQDLLDISKIEGGRLQFHNDYFYFDELVDEVVEEVQRTTDKHKLIKKGKTGKTLYGDKDRIAQVITNFLTNAIKYSPHSSKIIIQSMTEKAELILCVEDFGVGIPKGNIPHIFERFYRVKGKTHDTVPGMGLGLYISSEIITRQGGRIWAESEAGKGSKFCFSIPIKSKNKVQQKNTLVDEEIKHG